MPLLALLLLTASACSPAADARDQAQQYAAPAADHIAIVTRLAGAEPSRVADRADVLPDQVEHELASRSEALERATRDQVVVVTVPELGGLSIEQFGHALANHWGIGRRDLDNGVLLLVAPAEQRLRIEVGIGLEAVLTDQRAARIVAQAIPRFREAGVPAGVKAAFDGIEAELRARPERRSDG